MIAAARAFDAELIFDEGEPIRLKDVAGDLVDYPDTRETLRLRRALEPINAYLKELHIELPGAVCRRASAQPEFEKRGALAKREGKRQAKAYRKKLSWPYHRISSDWRSPFGGPFSTW